MSRKVNNTNNKKLKNLAKKNLLASKNKSQERREKETKKIIYSRNICLYKRWRLDLKRKLCSKENFSKTLM
jgi:hypothetical protein